MYLVHKGLDRFYAPHLGCPFIDPEFHEAMSMLPSDEFEANTVMEVVQKGFRLNERLIRPAMVVVSRGADD